MDNTAEKRRNGMPGQQLGFEGGNMSWNPGAPTGAWAESNTHEAIYEAVALELPPSDMVPATIQERADLTDLVPRGRSQLGGCGRGHYPSSVCGSLARTIAAKRRRSSRWFASTSRTTDRSRSP